MVTMTAVSTQLRSGALTGSWTLDPSATTVSLATKAMFGIVPVKGSFGDVTGSATVSATGDVSATLAVAATSINTKMKKRDSHLRSADFFDVEQFPTITVTINSVAESGEDLHATGTITLKTVTAPVTFPLTVLSLADGNVELDALITVDRSELGLGFSKMGATKMKNTLKVHAIFHRS